MMQPPFRRTAWGVEERVNPRFHIGNMKYVCQVTLRWRDEAGQRHQVKVVAERGCRQKALRRAYTYRRMVVEYGDFITALCPAKRLRYDLGMQRQEVA